MRLCVFLDDGVTESRARDLLSSWDSEEPRYALAVKPVSFQPLARGGFFHGSIVRQVGEQMLGPQCDRNLYFVGRNAGDFLWGDLAAVALPLPEVLGEVDDATLTSGFVVATAISFNQLLLSPYSVTRHEIYHLLGCKQHFDMPACYAEIAALKHRKRELMAEGFFSRIGEPPFYPTWDNLTDSMLVSRAAVNQVIAPDRFPIEAEVSGPAIARNTNLHP
ncbi:MAG TPA: hypothetical protein VGH29_15085 [Candidatus Binataceae bacterium]